MPTASFQKFNQLGQDLHHGVHNFSLHSLRIMLSNTAPVAGNSVKADIAEIAAGGGYALGGFALSLGSSTQVAGLYKLVLNDGSLVASGAVATFQYAILFNDTPASPLKPLIGYWTYPAPVNLLAGEPFTIDCDPTTGVLQYSIA